MIPEKIHYCWFGKGKKSRLALKCIESWHQYCPDYEMIEWNEENFDIDMNGYTRMCYAEKKYAYLSDYVRLWAVEKYGGIYLDTDVEVIRPLEKLLQEDAYFGFENKRYVNTGLGFGSAAHGAVVQAMLKEYDVLLDGKNGVRMCPELNTKALTALGLKQNGQKQKNMGSGSVSGECFESIMTVQREKLEKNSRYGFYSLVCGILDEQDTKITREDNKTDS